MPPFIFLVIIWAIKWFEITFGYSFVEWGISPRRTETLIGILTAPLVHGDLKHLFSNSSPVLVLGIGIFFFYKNWAYVIVGFITIFSGLLIWLFARGGTYHIGASGLIYGFAFFLFFSGIFKKNKSFMGVSLLVLFLYGGMLWGILPGEKGISWEAHLFGS
ncbi:MAG: rhomboid family intramembrane serine protease, partial [Sphingobacteriales bacterium]